MTEFKIVKKCCQHNNLGKCPYCIWSNETEIPFWAATSSDKSNWKNI